jgi:hypothetical protein
VSYGNNNEGTMYFVQDEIYQSISGIWNDGLFINNQDYIATFQNHNVFGFHLDNNYVVRFQENQIGQNNNGNNGEEHNNVNGQGEGYVANNDIILQINQFHNIILQINQYQNINNQIQDLNQLLQNMDGVSQDVLRHFFNYMLRANNDELPNDFDTFGRIILNPSIDMNRDNYFNSICTPKEFKAVLLRLHKLRENQREAMSIAIGEGSLRLERDDVSQVEARGFLDMLSDDTNLSNIEDLINKAYPNNAYPNNNGFGVEDCCEILKCCCHFLTCCCCFCEETIEE